jgi:hypothetical protein
MLNLPHLKKLEVMGICALFDFLRAAPNLDDLIIDFDCLKILMDDESTCDLLQQRIICLDVRYWTGIESDLLQRVIRVFCRLCYLCIHLKSSIMFTESVLSAILAHSNIKQLTTLTIVTRAPDDINKNLRQWMIDLTYLTVDDSFVVNHFDNFFILWK